MLGRLVEGGYRVIKPALLLLHRLVDLDMVGFSRHRAEFVAGKELRASESGIDLVLVQEVVDVHVIRRLCYFVIGDIVLSAVLLIADPVLHFGYLSKLLDLT